MKLFLISKYVDDQICEQSRLICGLCEELIHQNNFFRAEESIKLIQDKKWQGIGRKTIAIGYALEGHKEKVEQILKKVQYWDVKDSAYEDLGVLYFENDEPDLAINCFSQIKHQEYLKSALLSVAKKTTSTKIDHKILNHFLQLFIMHKSQNGVKGLQNICQKRILENRTPESLMVFITSKLAERTTTSLRVLTISEHLSRSDLEEEVLRKYNKFINIDEVHENQSVAQVSALCWLLISLHMLEECEYLVETIVPFSERLSLYEGVFQLMVSENSEISIVYLIKSLNLLRFSPQIHYINFLQRNLIQLEIIGEKNILNKILLWSSNGQLA